MKKLIILIFSMVVAGEMEVDGNLKVTGTVDSGFNEIHYITTIDINSIGEDLYNDIKGCTDPLASNFNPYASINDNSCTSRLLGDLNDDGLIDVIDVVIIISIILEQITGTEDQISDADFNQDGNVNVIDVIKMINFIVYGDVDNSFEWVFIGDGDFTYGSNDNIQNINYDYRIMKYNVTFGEFITWMNSIYEEYQCYIDGSTCWCWYQGDEVLSEGFRRFLTIDSSFGPDFNFGRIHWDGNQFYIDEEFINHPAIMLNYTAMKSFADYYNAVFPSLEEWEKAARGLTGNNYPFGDEISINNANYMNSGDPWESGTSIIGYFNGINGTIDSPSPYGIYDMCGNVSELTREFYYSGNHLVWKVRGGSWYNDSENELTTYYNSQIYMLYYSGYTSYSPTVGMRLVKHD